MNIFQKIKALFAVKGFIEDEIKGANQMNGNKPGYATSEFWLQLMVQAGSVWGAVSGFVPPKWAAIISAAGIAVYTVARTVAKAIADIQAAKATQTTVTTTQPTTTVTTPS